MLHTMGNRLKDLRVEQGWTQERAATEFGVSKSQYIKLERGDRRLNIEYIERAAKVFGVGAGEVTSGPEKVPLMGMIGAGGEISPDFEQVPDEGLEEIEVPFTLPGEMIALKVKGISMLPRYDDGDVIITWREQRRPTEYFLGREAAVRTFDGRRYLKRLQRGNHRGFDLISFNDVPIEGVQIEWIGEIHIVLRSDQLRSYEPPKMPELARRRA